MTLMTSSLSLSLFSLSSSSIACMREQLAQALASQQALIIERDQAKEQCKLAQDRASKLQKQLDLLRKVHSKSLTVFKFWGTRAGKSRCSPAYIHSLVKLCQTFWLNLVKRFSTAYSHVQVTTSAL